MANGDRLTPEQIRALGPGDFAGLSDTQLEQVQDAVGTPGAPLISQFSPEVKRRRKLARKAGRRQVKKFAATGLEQEDARTLAGGVGLGKEILDIVGLGGEDPLGRLDLAQSQQFTQQAIAGSPELQEVIRLQREGLGGLTSPELQAQRETGQAESDRTFQSNLRALQNLQARSGVRGAAAGAQARDVGTDRFRAQQENERRLLVENAAIQERRRQQLAQTVGQRFAQGLQAQRFGREGEVFNLGQLGQEISGRTGGILGGIGAATGLKTGRESLNLQGQAASQAAQASSQQLDLSRQIAEERAALERERFEFEKNRPNPFPTQPPAIV